MISWDTRAAWPWDTWWCRCHQENPPTEILDTVFWGSLGHEVSLGQRLLAQIPRHLPPQIHCYPHWYQLLSPGCFFGEQQTSDCWGIFWNVPIWVTLRCTSTFDRLRNHPKPPKTTYFYFFSGLADEKLQLCPKVLLEKVWIAPTRNLAGSRPLMCDTRERRASNPWHLLTSSWAFWHRWLAKHSKPKSGPLHLQMAEGSGNAWGWGGGQLRRRLWSRCPKEPQMQKSDTLQRFPQYHIIPVDLCQFCIMNSTATYFTVRLCNKMNILVMWPPLRRKTQSCVPRNHRRL